MQHKQNQCTCKTLKLNNSKKHLCYLLKGIRCKIINNKWSRRRNSELINGKILLVIPSGSSLRERHPATSPVFWHVLVRPGISAYGSELCSSSPPPLLQKAKGSVAPLQHGSERTASTPASIEKCKMTHSGVRARQPEWRKTASSRD